MLLNKGPVSPVPVQQAQDLDASTTWSSSARPGSFDFGERPPPKSGILRRLRLSLRTVISLIFAVEILLASSAVFLIVYLLSRQVINDIAASARDGIVSELKASVRSEILMPMMRAVRLSATAFEEGIVSPARTDELIRWFAAAAADIPTIYWLYLATDTGYFWGVQRILHPNGTFASWRFSIANGTQPNMSFEYPLAADGAIGTMYDAHEEYTPQDRPWFQAARAAAGRPAWSPVYSDFQNPDVLCITLALEAVVDGRAEALRYSDTGTVLPLPRFPSPSLHAGSPPLGSKVVFAADTALRDIPVLLANTRVTPNTLVWAVDSEGYMVASNRGTSSVLKNPAEGTRWLARECPEPLVRSAVREFEGGPRQLPARIMFDMDGLVDSGVHLTVGDLAGDLGVPLLLFVAVPDSDLSRAWQLAGLWSIAGTAALVALSTAVATLSAQLVTRPVRALTRQMASVLRLNSDPRSLRGGLLKPRLARRLSQIIRHAAEAPPTPPPPPPESLPAIRPPSVEPPAQRGRLDSTAMDVSRRAPFLEAARAAALRAAGLDPEPRASTSAAASEDGRRWEDEGEAIVLPLPLDDPGPQSPAHSRPASVADVEEAAPVMLRSDSDLALDAAAGVGLPPARRAPAPASFIREIDEMEWSFNRMRIGLDSLHKYVAKEVVASLMAGGRLGRLGLSEARVTILFVDIAGFTSLTEGLLPNSMAIYLQYFLTACTRIITAHGGIVDSFAGDQVMALWNAPVATPGHELLACRAALACQRALGELLLDLVASDGRRVRVGFRCRIGLHTGNALVGNIGSEERMSFTAIGDAVNLASRLESLCKHYGVPVLASGALVAGLAAAEPPRPAPSARSAGAAPAARLLDRVRAKGRTAATDVYAVVGAEEPPGALPRAEWPAYEAALLLLWEGRCAEAAAALAALETRWPADRPTAVLRARAAAFAADPLLYTAVFEPEFK